MLQNEDNRIQDSKPKWLWLLVIPALVAGIIPGFFVRLSWEWGTSIIPFIDLFMAKWGEIMQAGSDGFCTVFFPSRVAPSHKMAVGVIAAVIIVLFSLWTLFLAMDQGSKWGAFLILVTGIVAAGTAWYVISADKDK